MNFQLFSSHMLKFEYSNIWLFNNSIIIIFSQELNITHVISSGPDTFVFKNIGFNLKKNHCLPCQDLHITTMVSLLYT